MPDTTRIALIPDVHGDLGAPLHDGYELEPRHGIYRGMLEEWRSGELLTGSREREAVRA